MIEKLFATYQEKPLAESLTAYDVFMSSAKSQGIKIDDEALAAYSLAVEQAAFKAGFSAAVALMQETALISSK